MKIKELIDLMNENGLTEIEVETDGSKIKLSKKGQGAVEHPITRVTWNTRPSH